MAYLVNKNKHRLTEVTSQLEPIIAKYSLKKDNNGDYQACNNTYNKILEEAINV